MEDTHNPLERYRGIVDDWNAWQEALQQPLPTTLWVHPHRISLAEISDLFRAEGARLHPIPWQPGAFRLTGMEQPRRSWLFAAGLFHLQEEVSMIPAALLEAHPGERILDLCAAPGSKALQLACRLGHRGTLVANDLNRGRLPAVVHHMERLGLTNITVTQGNGTNLPPDAGPYHRILVDAPCSCEGTSRKNPKVLHWGQDYWKKLQTTQIALLRKALQLVQIGGRVVYSTCTYAPEENELVVLAILEELGDFVRLVPARIRGLKSSEGLLHWDGRNLNSTLRQTLRIWPHHNNTGGFFAAVLEKTGAPEHWPQPSALGGEPLPLQDPRGPEIKPWLDGLRDRFGIEATTLGDLSFFTDSSGSLHWVNRDHRPPERPVPISSGLLFLRTNINHPKIPTGTANQLAAKIRRNVVDLERSQVDVFLRREAQGLGEAQLRACDAGEGYVFVRYRGHGLGQGMLHRKSEGTVLSSLWPKAWMG